LLKLDLFLPKYIFERIKDLAPPPDKVPDSIKDSKSSGDPLFDFRHADASLSQVIIERNIKVMEKPQDILMIVSEAFEDIVGYGLFH
jgi:hypothetical protein